MFTNSYFKIAFGLSKIGSIAAIIILGVTMKAVAFES